MEDTRMSTWSWEELVQPPVGLSRGVEATRRLVVAYSNHSEVMSRPTMVIVFLTSVLMVLAAVQVGILIGDVT